MIVRRSGTTQLLITQPDHAALAARIMRHWTADALLSSLRRSEILLAVAEHDNGWREVDVAPLVDRSTGDMVDYVHIPDDVKRGIWPRGIARLAHAPYAAALVAQHALHIYRRYAAEPGWASFFEEVAAARAAHLSRVPSATPDDLRRDYFFLRIGDLMSLTFCNARPESEAEQWGYKIRIEDARLTVTQDPFGGRAFAIEVPARAPTSEEPIVVRGVVSGG